MSSQRVRASHLAWLTERLSERDWLLVETVNRLHVASGIQLDRVGFEPLQGHSRTVSRSRTLARLVRWRVLQRLPRRIGGPRRGSSVAVYALDTGGQKLLLTRAGQQARPDSVRRPVQPSERFVKHMLATSELYVELVEAERRGALILRQFQTEPAAWWSDGRGGWLKPDGFAVTSNGDVDQLWWIEVDRATETPKAVMKQLRAYLNFVNRGGLGPRNTVPLVLVTVPSRTRQTILTKQIGRLPAPASELFNVALHETAVSWITGQLRR